MCRIPKIAIVAPADRQGDLRRALSSLEYDIVAAVASVTETENVTADVIVLWEPEANAIEAMHAKGVKTVSLGGTEGADLQLATDDVASFKTRIWELFRPR